jgi:hypothetical protein
MQHPYIVMLSSVPDIKDDDSIHSDATYSDSDSEDSIHGFDHVVQPYEELVIEI